MMGNVGEMPGEIEWMTNEQMRGELREVAAELDVLQGQMAEWSELHHFLHESLVAFTVFQARLTPFGEHNGEHNGRYNLDAGERQMLLQDWRLCQSRLDALADFAEGVKCIGRSFRREGRKLYGERWAVEVIALQLLFEDALTENDLNLVSLFELAEEFNTVCHRYLALADRKLLTAVDELRRLSTRLLGEMQ
ncbi:MAG TPA: hypothetical protein G4N99_06630 [Thermoflexia bacterium]|nr:hypothetical protein [Thermoflexia bacterium]